MVKQAVRPIWTLLLGILLIQVAGALQGSLLGVRASLEGFNTIATGLVMAGYYAGFLLGSWLVPRWIKNVGHIRVFAAVASLASVTILTQSVIVNPWFWTLMRIGTGLCYAGLYIVTESWLNDKATNESRGQIFSVYMIVTWGGLASGQLLLNVSSPSGYDLFILTSVLISVALVPLLLIRTPSPTIEVPEKLNIGNLIRTAPLGALSVWLAGVTGGCIIGMAAVYAQLAGMSTSETAFFVGLGFVGGLLLQWPIGRLSDRQDRRITILMLAFLGFITAIFVPLGQRLDSPLLMMIGMFMAGGFSFPMYSLAASHINDQLRPEQILSASSGMILLNGVGGVIGPIAASFFMSTLSINALFYFIGAVNMVVMVFAYIRIRNNVPMVVEEQGDQVPVGVAVSSVGAAEMLSDADASQPRAEEEVTEVEIRL